jgi:hypothetical protein
MIIPPFCGFFAIFSLSYPGVEFRTQLRLSKTRNWYREAAEAGAGAPAEGK